MLEIGVLKSQQNATITPGPAALAERVIELATESDSVVPDSFPGSGTMAHVVVKANSKDEGNRRFVLVDGEKKISERVEGLGGDFAFCTLGKPIGVEKILCAENLADHERPGARLFHTATDLTFAART